MLERLTQIEARYDDLSAQMADPALVSDQQQYQKITKQHRDLPAGGRKHSRAEAH